MHNVMLSWQQGAALTVVLGTVAVLSTILPGRFFAVLAPFARESTIIAALYAIWQLAGDLSVLGTRGAFARARWIEHTEHTLHLPSEASMQALTSNPVAARVANIYYATMHFGALFVFLIWLFVRHRDRYREVRRVLAVATLICLLIQLLPVAPPRLLPGYVDTAQKYGESVYNFGIGADELSAMPSVHVAWAVLIGWTVWRIGRGRWRWIGAAHAVITVLVVVSTANHWWADGVVAVAVLVVSWLICRGAERAAASIRARIGPDTASPVGLSCAPARGILPTTPTSLEN